MKETLYQFNPWWEKEFLGSGVVRTKYIDKMFEYLDLREVVLLTGLRRVGKTTLFHQFLAKLILEKNISSKNIFYISCEHPVFEKLSLIEILDEYRKIFGFSREEKIFVFFDEIQLKPEFERDLKLIYDMQQGVKVFVSGSMASVLRNKKAYLTGRVRTIEVNPLDFEEYLLFKNLKVTESEIYLGEKYFLDYLKFGGMPEYVLREDVDYMLSLIDTILYKDIVSFYGLKNPKLVRDLFILLCERIGKPLSYTKLANILGLSVDTVSQYISYFEDAYLIYIVNKDSKSLNEQIRANKKIYIADSGFRNILVGFKDLGAVFENLVFLKHKSEFPKYILDGGKEIDFYIKEKDLVIEAKFKKEILEEELRFFNQSKFKNKILVTDWTYFRKE